MRDVPDVLKAQSGQDVHTNAITVNALPPAYMKGFTLADRDGQLVISPGIGNIKGTRVSLKDEYIVSGDDYIASDSIIPNLFYTVYVNKEANFIVDSVDPVKDLNYYAYYHPTREDYRYIGQFYLATGGAHQQIVSYDPLGFNSLNTNLVDTLLLAVQTFLSIGYTGQGTLDNPVEGDKYMYIDGDEINVLEYAGGAWLAKLRFGGEIGGNFMAQIQGNTVNHIDNDTIDNELFPTKNHKVFTFSNTYNDQHGQNPWAGNINMGFTTSWSKFGTHSLTGTAAGALLFSNYDGDIGESVSMTAYCKLDVRGTTQFVPMGFTRSDSLYIRIYPVTEEIGMYVIKGGTTTQTLRIGVKQFGGFDNVEYMGFTYDADTDTLSLIVNDVIETQVGIPGTWSAATTWRVALDPWYTAGASSTLYSELTLSYTDYVKPQALVEHYNHQKAWETAVSRADQAIYCAPGGRIQFLDHMPQESLGTLHLIPNEDRPSTFIVWSSGPTSWTTVDLSSYVPFGVTAVELDMIVNGYYAADAHFAFRVPGSTVDSVWKNQSVRVYTSDGVSHNRQVYYTQTILCNVQGEFEYKSRSPGGLIYINLYGYYI